MLLVVHGFESHSEALAFEWAWQNPTKSKNARAAVGALVGKGTTAAAGARGRVRVLLAMLNAPAWRDMPLTVTVLSSAHEHLLSSLSLPAEEAARGLPRGMRVETAPVEMLVVGRVAVETALGEELERDPEGSSEEEGGVGEEEEEGAREATCSCCSLPLKPGDEFIPCVSSSNPSSPSSSSSSACRARSHPECLADRFLSLDSSGGGVVPTSGRCPLCEKEASWVSCLERVGTVRLFSSPRLPSPSRRLRLPSSSPATGAEAAPTTAASGEGTPRKGKTKSPQQRRRRRQARVVPKATPEELAAFAAAARENAPPVPPLPAAPIAAAALPRASPSKRPLIEASSEPIVIGSSSSEDEGDEKEKRKAAAAAPALPLSPLASRLAALSPPSSAPSLGKLRGGARPGEWPPKQQGLLQQHQQQQRGAGRARALHGGGGGASSVALAAPLPLSARLPRMARPLLRLPTLPGSSASIAVASAASAAAALASSVAAVASRGRFSGARRLRGLGRF